MESAPNPFPKIELFPRVRRLVHFLFDHIQDPGLSDHAHRVVEDPYDPAQMQLGFEEQASKGW